MNAFQLTYKRFGENSILIEWPTKIDEAILNDLLQFKSAIQKHLNDELVYVNSAYNSILVRYVSLVDIELEIERLKVIYNNSAAANKAEKQLWKIPVCYDLSFGIDLEELSKLKKLPIEKLIDLHCSQVYQVYFTGFLPGFLYLGGLQEILHTARRASPRLKVLKGAVAIGGEQTGIYPNESPGGWNVIGNSPINLFDSKLEIPCNIKAGHSLQFIPITLKEHKKIKVLVEAGVYQLESSVIND